MSDARCSPLDPSGVAAAAAAAAEQNAARLLAPM